MSKCDELIAVAKSWLGRNEQDGSFKEIIDIYNQAAKKLGLYVMKYTDPWCAAFITACAWKCKMTDIIAPSASCDAMISWYKKNGEWKERSTYTPKKGDIVFYDWDKNGTSDHVGLITSISGTTMKVIEGNASDKVLIRSFSCKSTQVKGFGVPEYDLITIIDYPEPETPIEPTPTVELTCKIMMPLLKKGDGMGDRKQYKPYVKRLQQMLINDGYDLGTYKDDGEWGGKTETAFRAWQKKKKLTVDGKCGVKSWNKLFGG